MDHMLRCACAFTHPVQPGAGSANQRRTRTMAVSLVKAYVIGHPETGPEARAAKRSNYPIVTVPTALFDETFSIACPSCDAPSDEACIDEDDNGLYYLYCGGTG